MKYSKVIFFAVLFAAVVPSGCSRESFDDAVRNGQSALFDRRYKEAIPHLKRIVFFSPESSDAHYNLGMAYLGVGKNSAASREFERSVELSNDPTDTAALEALGEARRRRGRFVAAKSAYERAMSKAGRHGRTLAGLAACEMAEGHNEYALSLLQEAYRDAPGDPAVIYNLAVLKKNVSRDLKTATDFFVRYLMMTPPGKYPLQDASAIKALAEIHKQREPDVISAVTQYMDASDAASDAGSAVKYAYGAVLADPTDSTALVAFIKKLRAAGREDDAARMEARLKRLFPGISAR